MEGGIPMNESILWQQSRLHTCCLTGHRQLPTDPDQLYALYESLRCTIVRLVGEQIDQFYVGGALGFDTLAAMTVLEMKARFPQIRLLLAVPYPGQSSRWNSTGRRMYDQIRDHADQVEIISPTYTADCMKKRNYHMVRHSCVCVYYLVNPIRSGTAQTVHYANRQGCRMIDLLREQEKIQGKQGEDRTNWNEEVFLREASLSESEAKEPEPL